ncbi:MAG: DNA pilot protein [Microvirus sp.]|nr:MAG: DNA pilot protein [Microvirus sp.]
MGLKKLFKKVGKVVKKAAPVAAGAAAMYYGGPALAGMLGGGPTANAQQATPTGPNDLGRVEINGSAPFNWNNAIGIGAAGLSYLGGKQANDANAKQAQAQMDFQAQQTGTAYQRATADMQQAGLNPMLAYSQGGASSGSGASANISDEITPALSSAKQGAMYREQLNQLQLQNDNISATNENIGAQTRNTEVDTLAKQAQIPGFAQGSTNQVVTGKEIQARVDEILQRVEQGKKINPLEVKRLQQAIQSQTYSLVGEKNSADFNRAIGEYIPGGAKTAGAVGSTAKGLYELTTRLPGALRGLRMLGL